MGYEEEMKGAFGDDFILSQKKILNTAFILRERLSKLVDDVKKELPEKEGYALDDEQMLQALSTAIDYYFEDK